MAARKDLKPEDRKIAYKPRGPYSNKGKRLGRKPGTWKVGPDSRRHDQYTAWLKHKSQAAYRQEEHTLSFEQWETIWNTDSAWENRGRENTSINLRRKDKEKGWTWDNVELIERKLHLQQSAQEHLGMTYNRGKK